MDRIFPFLKPLRNDSDGQPSKAAAVAETTKNLVAAPLGLANSSSGEADLVKWRRSFDANANVEKDGQKYLDEGAFVKAIAPASDLAKIGARQYGILFRVADSSQKGLVSWDDFVMFETLLRRPDAEFVVAFKVFDVDGNGEVTFDEFKNTFQSMMGKEAIPFNFDSPWVKLYLGKRSRSGEHVLGYNEFTQLMKGLQGERLRQAFAYFDKDETGYISPEDFARIIRELARHKLSDSVIQRLPTLCNLTAGRKISYSEVIAFHNVLREMDLAERIIREGCEHSKDARIDRNDFLTIASRTSRYGVFSPMEAAIIFHFAGLGNDSARLSLNDFAQLLDPKWERPDDADAATVPAASLATQILKSAYNFALGGLAGATGATAVYPIDLVKTRMQNQRSKVVGELLYKNSIDCVKKVYKNEGFTGFYRGLPPQLIGVAPEKAIKLTVNDLVRGYAKDKQTGAISVGWELFAGGAAGGCQVVFTNPLEIVKIRLQMQGEAAKRQGADVVPRGAGHIIKQLGLVGLYRGATACLCRDIPFSAIYFPGYAHLKKDVFHEGKNGKKLSFLETLSAAAIAGMPAAYLTTPADVVKTRLQSEARKGETTYNGVVHCFRTILSEEGPRALFKGGPARILRSSPQFGVTLVAYEYLQALLPYPFDDKAKQVAISTPAEDLSRIRARNALKILLDVHENFAVSKS